MNIISKKANKFLLTKNFSEALKEYKKLQSSLPEIAKNFEFNINFCLKNIDSAVEQDKAPEVYVTLTTINSRLDKLKPVLESLINQTLLPKKIILNLSEDAYLLDNGVKRNNATLSSISAINLVEINWTPNTGPYRKIVPFMEHYYAQEDTTDRIFITVDDDTIYPEYFIKTLYEQHIENDCIVAFRGRHISIKNGAIDTYKKWGLGKNEPSMKNLPTGKDGVIYNTKFFTKDFINIEKAKELAPTADDLWIKWHTGLNGVKAIILNPEAASSDYKSFPVVDYSNEYRDISLFRAHNSHGSEGKNDLSTKNLERYYQENYGYNLASLCSEGQ